MSAPRCTLALAAVAVGLVVFAGAVRGTDAETGSVEGKVSVNGQPLAKGKIIFHPKQGKTVEAKVKQGEYKAENIPAGDTTIVVKGDGVPKPFQSAKTSPLTLEIKKGNQRNDFELTK